MGVFPAEAQIIPNPYNKIPGFTGRPDALRAGLPGHGAPRWWRGCSIPLYPHLHGSSVQTERSVIVHGAMEASLTPLMEEIEARFAGIKVFSLPSVDHPVHGRHIELGVKRPGHPGRGAAYRRTENRPGRFRRLFGP